MAPGAQLADQAGGGSRASLRGETLGCLAGSHGEVAGCTHPGAPLDF